MENASKALIMAGGVLIGIIVISMAVYLFSQAAAIPKNYDEELRWQNLEAFNGQFETYMNKEKKDTISGQDIVTVINLAAENNKERSEEDELYIKVYLDKKLINNYTEKQKIELMENTNATGDFYSFSCVEVGYNNPSGRVNSIKFVKK